MRLQQSSHYPEFGIDVDRTRAGETGITERDVTNSLVVNLAGSFQVAPAFWLNPKNGVSYPDRDPDAAIPAGYAGRAQEHADHRRQAGNPQLLGGLSDIHRQDSDAVVSHYAIQPAFDVYATTQDRDLGAVAGDIQQVLDDTAADLPPGATVTIRGQVETMNAAFSGLFFGLAEAIVLIYLLIVVNFHSWSDPFVIVMALPAALAGIAWTLFATHTTPQRAGADRRHHVHGRGDGQFDPGGQLRARAAGGDRRCRAGGDRGRRHPLPPGADDGAGHDHRHGADGAGLGEGGEQNAPLGRAVIGGLMFATFATLFFVPAVFALVRGRVRGRARLVEQPHVPGE